jgi:hypothetical protein
MRVRTDLVTKSDNSEECGTFVAGKILACVRPNRLAMSAQASRGWFGVALVGFGFVSLGLICVALAFGSDELTLDRVENVTAYRANGGYVVHRFPLDLTSPPEVRSRTYHMRGREHTAHYLCFNGFEETTFVFDHHSPDDLRAAAAAIGEFLEEKNSIGLARDSL